MIQLYRVSTYAPNVVHFARELPTMTGYTSVFRNAEALTCVNRAVEKSVR